MKNSSMCTLLIKKLKKNYKSILCRYYIESEFIDSVDEIIYKIKNRDESISRPFGVYLKDDLVAFFIIESSRKNLRVQYDSKGSYWLESFFLTKEFRGKGLAENVVLEIIKSMKAIFSDITSLNLTVNLKNHIAKKIYQTCGFTDIEQLYLDGPAGPQKIFSIII